MKQNKSIRLMSILMILVMLSSIYASTTIARFSDVVQSSDTTRVAIWDINANEVIMDLFNTVYTDEETGNTLAKSHNTDNIIAPGTHGESLFSIVNHKGDIAPEVMYYIQIDLDDSQVSNDIITNSNIQWKLDNGSWGTWDQLKVALYSLSGSPSGIKTYQAGVLADAFKKNVTHSISWQWLEDDIDTNTMTDDIDYTALINVKVTARQTDTVYADAVGESNFVVNLNDTIEPISIKSSAPLSEFQEVKVNDVIVDDDNYTLTEGSTVVTFKTSYLESLPVGGYTVSIVSQKQTVNVKFDIVDREVIINGIVHNGIIPEGGTYYHNIHIPPTYSVHHLGNYYDATIFEAGKEFPEPKTSDAYVYGDYEYRYNMRYISLLDEWDEDTSMNGWGVAILDRNKNKYDELLTTINNKNLISTQHLFSFCSSLTEAPVIPNTVTDMYTTFLYCTSLTKAPVIPSNVINMSSTFEGCSELTGIIEIKGNPSNNVCTFSYTEKPITLIGDSIMLNEIAATATNGNVKVANYNDGTNQLYVSNTLSENSWDTISKVTKAGKATDYWEVGDKTTVKVNGLDKGVAIADFNHDGDNTVTFVFTEYVDKFIVMNDEPSNSGSWEKSKMRTVTIPEILNQMENKDLIKEVEKKTIKGGYDACLEWNEEEGYCENEDSEKAYELVTTNDKLFLLSYDEVFDGWLNEGTQYEYFKTVENRLLDLYGDGYGAPWWLRTPIDFGYDGFKIVDYRGEGDYDYANNSDNYYVIPAFVIG